MLYFIIGLTFSLSIQAGEWWTLPRTEDAQFIYYVGVAEGRKEKFSQVLDQATNKAMSDIIREHFGMSVQITETSVEELTSDSFQVVSKHSSAPLFIKGTTVVRSFERPVGETTRVYVQIRAEKTKIAESVEKHRLGLKEEQLNTYGESHASMVNFKVKTYPTGALINLSHLDQRYAIQGQGDAIFNIPRGRYKMVITAPGYLEETRELLIQSNGREEFINLDELYSLLELTVVPEDAEVSFNGVKSDQGSFHLTIGNIFEIGVSHPDFLSQTIEIISHYPENLSRTVVLEPKKSTLIFDIEPKGAEVNIDHQSVSTYQGKVLVSPGERLVTVSHPGYEDFREITYVQPNREYPLKVIRLKKLKPKPKSKPKPLPVREEPRAYTHFSNQESPSDQRLALRVEYNPGSVMGDLGRFDLIPVGLHLEWPYISLGVGMNYTIEEKEKKDENQLARKEEKSYLDLYTTVRLISPRMGNFKLFASGTLGGITHSYKSFDQLKPVTRSKSYRGMGGGVRWYVSQRWSAHGEVFNVQATDKEKNLKVNERRIILGVGYEF